MDAISMDRLEPWMLWLLALVITAGVVGLRIFIKGHKSTNTSQGPSQVQQNGNWVQGDMAGRDIIKTNGPKNR